MPPVLTIAFVVLVVLVIAVALLVAARSGRAEGRSGVLSGVLGGGPFRLIVSEPEFSSLMGGAKKIEARPNQRPYDKLAVGDSVVVVRSRPRGDTSERPDGKYKYDAEVTKVRVWPSIEELLAGEGVQNVYPGMSAGDAAARFKSFASPAKGDPAKGVVAIGLRPAAGKKKASA